MATERSAASEDAPHDPVAAAQYRKLLEAEEEAGLYEEPIDEERVEVDASAQPDDSLAVRRRVAAKPRLRRCGVRASRRATITAAAAL